MKFEAGVHRTLARLSKLAASAPSRINFCVPQLHFTFVAEKRFHNKLTPVDMLLDSHPVWA